MGKSAMDERPSLRHGGSMKAAERKQEDEEVAALLAEKKRLKQIVEVNNRFVTLAACR